MTFAITIARGGSKRLPGKNTRLLCGHPLVAWSIVQARTSKYVEKVYLSTDTDELQAIGEYYGAEVIRRPDWPDADQVAANRPFIHALELLMKRGEIKRDDEFVNMLPTTPCIKPGDIDILVEKYREFGADQVVAYARQRETVVYKVMPSAKVRCDLFNKDYSYVGQGFASNVTSVAWYLNNAKKLGTDLDTVIDAWSIEERLRESYCGLLCEPWQAVDVDTKEEFELAELYMNYYILKGRTMAETYGEYRDE